MTKKKPKKKKTTKTEPKPILGWVVRCVCEHSAYRHYATGGPDEHGKIYWSFSLKEAKRWENKKDAVLCQDGVDTRTVVRLVKR